MNLCITFPAARKAGENRRSQKEMLGKRIGCRTPGGAKTIRKANGSRRAKRSDVDLCIYQV